MPRGVFKRTKETRMKISKARTGKHHSLETRKKMVKAWEKRPPVSEETKQKLRKASTGRKYSEEIKSKMRKNSARYWLGKHHSDETKIKIGKASRCRKHSLESKIKIGKSHFGKKLSLEHRIKLSIAHKGISRGPLSQSTKDKIRKALKGKPRLDLRGPNSPSWKGGKSLEPYTPDWIKIRKKIYERDGWTCQECNHHCYGKKYKDEKRKIQCHHIDYNKKNNKFDNLITLCVSCHVKTRYNRKDWIKYYQLKIKEIKTLCNYEKQYAMSVINDFH